MDRKELELKTGLDARTIRFLVAEGIVPSPNGTGRGAHYDSTHLQAIDTYKSLRASGITSLEVIREKVRTGNKIAHVFAITPDLELHFHAGALSYQKFMLDPQVLSALEILKKSAERNS